MVDGLTEILDKGHYVRFKYIEDDAYILLPVLYYTDEIFVLYNKNGLPIHKDKEVALCVSDDTYEFVIHGTIASSERNITVNISKVEKHRNRRKNMRFDLNLEIDLLIQGKKYTGKIVNVSDSGALITVDGEVTCNLTVDFELASTKFESVIVREDIRNNRKYYGIRFNKSLNILNILKKVPSFDADLFNDVIIYVVLDDFSDVSNYKNLFEKNISVNFININAGCESFIIDYIENKHEELIFLDMEKEENILSTIKKFKKYMNAEKKIIVLIRDNYSDKLLKEVERLGIGLVLKPFIGEEIKNLLMKMS